MAKGSIHINIERCKGCGLCVNVCPSKILTLSNNRYNSKGYHHIVVEKPEKCIGCGSCAIICPDVVFTVYRYVNKPKSVPVITSGG